MAFYERVRKAACVLAFASAVIGAAALDSFSGTVELATGVTMLEEHKLAPILSENFSLVGQVRIADFAQVRFDVSAYAPNFFPGAFFNAQDSHKQQPSSPAAFFHANELSFTFQQWLSCYSLFVGVFEPFGTNDFMRAQLGTPSFASLLVQKRFGSEGAALYPSPGFGVSYAQRLDAPLAWAAYAGITERDYDKVYAHGERDPAYVPDFAGTEKITKLDFDVRAAGAFPLVSFDASFGLGIPKQTLSRKKIPLPDNSGNQQRLLLRGWELRGGLSVLAGNSYVQSVLVQAAVPHFWVGKVTANTPHPETTVDDIFFLLEPRFALDPLRFVITTYSAPESVYNGEENDSGLFYITEPLGMNVAVFAEPYSAARDVTDRIGVNVTFASKKTLSGRSVAAVGERGFGIYAAPFCSFAVFGGTLDAAARVDVCGLSVWQDSFEMRLGYRAAF
ncbi:hypothetical protein [Treponema endosymbiont of Eucomonympha sp.]|uniref:hypothetical protein n=1 Tax=Treponema endosymbiont of Eucomonympha sp. TaxID=1580831 RepID=UPI000750FF66|nr:hypothetical protein [Treponema endosymbiont of Eucomonympha sp.]